MKKAAIIGAAGYTGGELIRVLLQHPQVDLVQCVSASQHGKPLHTVHQDLLGTTSMKFTEELNDSVDVVFLAMGHGKSAEWVKQHPQENTLIVDLSHDFRLDPSWTYGLPEAQPQYGLHIANPGCFATAIELALLPLKGTGILQSQSVVVNAITGSTGAGVMPSKTTHFSYRSSNVSTYKVLKHQHLKEINKTIGLSSQLMFVPMRGDFTRGILANVVFKVKSDFNVQEVYRKYYEDAVFTHVSEDPVHLKQVVNTNKCLIHITQDGENVVITSVIDNLIKGAAGQAIQNMNIAMGLEETAGLMLKASVY